MKAYSYIKRLSVLLLAAAAASCSYLDVIPPEQQTLDDTMKDATAVEAWLYSCYGEAPYLSRIEYLCSTDEWCLPTIFNDYGQVIAWNQLNSSSVWQGNATTWTGVYSTLGQCNLFPKRLAEAEPLGVTEDMKSEYRAEISFLVAYCHMRALQQYGPIPIIDYFIPQNTPLTDIPGRSHFDYCVDYIARKFDEAVEGGYLPAYREQEWGRATSSAALALKARLLVYAASDLWNVGFPDRNWKNTKFETPGYGYELVSHTYDEGKWERALKACNEAITHATTLGGHKLMQVSDIRSGRPSQVPKYYIPDNTSDDFEEHVRLMGFLLHTTPAEGNMEYIWGTRHNWLDARYSMPLRIIQQNNSWVSGYSLMAPTLYSMEHFYTSRGKLPENDPEFPSKTEWLTSAGVSGRPDITKLCVDREPRFYAWMAFDGGEYLPKIQNGKSMTLNMRSSSAQGWTTGANRNCSVTGFLSKKFVNPDIVYTNTGGGPTNYVKPFIRLAELYLLRAECYAALDQTDLAIEDLNVVRSRAGVPDLTKDMIEESGMTITDWVRNERFIELWAEGMRYWDLRRWKIAPQQMKAGAREGLNVMSKYDPTFEEFNVRTKIDQPFTWNDRMYLYPVYIDEVYSNPQMVQAPGY